MGYSCYMSVPGLHSMCLGLIPVQHKEAVQVCSHALSPQARMAMGLITLRTKHETSLCLSFCHKDFPKCAEQQGLPKAARFLISFQSDLLKDRLKMGTDCLLDLGEPQFYTKPRRCLRAPTVAIVTGGISAYTDSRTASVR